MNSSTLRDRSLVDFEADSAETRPNRRRWWRVLTRSGRPRRMGRRHLMERMHSDHLRLVETLDRISERLEGPADTRPTEADPVPLFEGIRHISDGQQRIGSALESLETLMERGFETDTRLAAAVDRIDHSLGDVRKGHAATTSALGQLGDRMEDSTHRLERIFLQIQEADRRREEELRRLKNRAMIGFAGIASGAVAAVALLVASPWA